ncbi:MAG: CPBP family intramembrane metalloprotease [Algoriphagus sp.]|nr:CPBP family intramembrane metalloprotease [Algoriphagus sp.]
MVIIIIELLISGILLWFYDKSNLLILGLQPTKEKIVDFIFGFFSSAILCALGLYLIIIVIEPTLTFNPDFTFITFLNSSFWMLKSVLGEELLFRGALLYIGIKKLGLKNACILSSIIFGIYHWFSYGIFGDFSQMIYIFFLTGISGLLFAFSFALTKSIYLPVGLHLGWNLISVVIFSGGPLGKQMLIFDGGDQLDGFWTAIFYIYQITILPFATYIFLNRK